MSKPQCRPGDLAIILGAHQTPQNNGKIVRVLRRYTGELLEGNQWATNTGLTWVIEATGSDLVTKGEFTGTISPCRVRAMSDSALWPIRDPGQADTTTTTKELEAA